MSPRNRFLGSRTWMVLACFAAGCGQAPGASTGPGDATTSGASHSGGGDSSSSNSGGGGAGGTTGSAGGPPFALVVHTALSPEKALELSTNLPALVDACEAAPFADTPCADLDQDGLADAWEDVVIDRLRPLLRLDEQESLVGEASAVVADVARVALVTAAPLRVRVFIMIGYSKDYGSCGFTAHNGDPERVALDLGGPADGAPGDVTTLAFYTAAHENTSNDHSQVFPPADFEQLTFENDALTGEPRWVVFPSQDKHGTYASLEICENVSAVPCLDEDCGPDGASRPGDFDRLPPFVNAGEEAHPRVSDLGALGFPGDDAWAKKDFCGGLGGSACSAQVRDKLLNDVF